ncbi:hypothetical protein B2J88_01745 [Rhodococcus sp. SRB_17]|nr:hypothetical protein [Rhodococcus sp. SRB_17]
MNLNIKGYIVIGIIFIVLIVGGLWILFFPQGGGANVPSGSAGVVPNTGQLQTTVADSHDHLPEGWVPEGKARPTPPPENKISQCSDGHCGDEPAGINIEPEIVRQWEDVATGFANNFGSIGNRSKDEWLDSLRPFALPALIKKMETIEYDRIRPGGTPQIVVSDSSQFRQVSVRADYPEGWGIYIKLELMGFEDWKVTTYDTPR